MEGYRYVPVNMLWGRIFNDGLPERRKVTVTNWVWQNPRGASRPYADLSGTA